MYVRQALLKIGQNSEVSLQKNLYYNSVKIKSILMPISWYNINSYNNTFTINSTVVTLVKSQYDVNELCAHLSTISTAIGANTFEFNYSSTTGKITILESGTTNFALTWDSNNVLRNMLGFTENKTGSYTYTGANIVNMRYTESIYIKFDNFQTLHNYEYDSMNESIDSANIGLLLNDNVANWGYNQKFEIKTAEGQILEKIFRNCSKKIMTRIMCTFLDEYGNNLEMNGRKANFVFQIFEKQN